MDSSTTPKKTAPPPPPAEATAARAKRSDRLRRLKAKKAAKSGRQSLVARQTPAVSHERGISAVAYPDNKIVKDSSSIDSSSIEMSNMSANPLVRNPARNPTGNFQKPIRKAPTNKDHLTLTSSTTTIPPGRMKKNNNDQLHKQRREEKQEENQQLALPGDNNDQKKITKTTQQNNNNNNNNNKRNSGDTQKVKEVQQEFKRNQQSIQRVELELNKLQQRSQHLSSKLKDLKNISRKQGKTKMLHGRTQSVEHSRVNTNLTKLGLNAQSRNHMDSIKKRAQSRRTSIFAEFEANPKKLARQISRQKSVLDQMIDDVNADMNAEKQSACMSFCLEKIVLMIGLLFSIVIGISIVSVLLFRAGNDTINKQVKSTMRLTSRRVVLQLENRLDSEAFGLNMISDALGRGIPSSSDLLVLPSSDLLWLETRDMLAPTAIYFGSSEGNIYGAGKYQKNKETVTKIMSKTETSKYMLYDVNYNAKEALNLQTIPDSNKRRLGKSVLFILIINYYSDY